jgi:predicted MFS family arabinose efflux permease
MLCYIVGTTLGQAATNYPKLVAARVIQGLAQNAFESIPIAAIGYIILSHNFNEVS